MSSKYQNPDDHQNIKITALSTPNFARKASFFSIFKDLQENHTENWQKRQILQKILRTKFQNTKISGHILIFCPFLVFRYFTSILDFYFEIFKSASPGVVLAEARIPGRCGGRCDAGGHPGHRQGDFLGLYILERKTNIFKKCTNSFISSSCAL